MSRPNSKKNPREDDQHPAVREPSIMLSDLIDELIWPRMLRAPALALSPNRLISGCVGVFLVTLIFRLYHLLRGTPSDEAQAAAAPITTPLSVLTDRAWDALSSLDPILFAYTAIDTARLLRDSVVHNPLLSILLGIPIIAVLTLAGGCIARSTAFEFAQGRFATREETLHFTLQRARQFVGAIIGPIAFSVVLFLLIAVGGLLLSVPVVDVGGALLYAIGLAMGIVATIVLVLHVLAAPMIVPALAIEGSDAFDAIQRCYAYVVGRPLRYITYVVFLTLLGVLAGVLFAMIARVSIDMTDSAATLLANDATDRALSGQGELGATKEIAHEIIGMWRGIIELIVVGYFVSLFFTSSTLLYLAARRICDGQGITEIWEPTTHD